ncbi:Carboxypeptidase regulatory-like domain-containing protein [Candidatus Electrothrix laxa]
MQELPSEKQIRLTVRAHDRLSEIFLVNSRFQLIAADVGQLEALVLPGIYKARFRIGQKQVDQLIEVSPEAGPLEVDGIPVDFNSPVPFAGIDTGLDVHRDAAEKFSRSPVEQKGEGSWLFLFIRNGVGSASVSAPWEGVSLHNLDGTLLAEPSQGICDQENGFFALHLEVDPGTYRLRVEEEPGESYEMFVRTIAGWQTQVFAFSEAAWLTDADASRPVLPSASVLMVEAGQGFDGGNESARQTDLLRLGLLHGRKIVTEVAVASLLQEEPLNPMQVIFAAHSLSGQGRSIDVADVVISLSALLKKLPADFCEHPDLQALMLHQEAEVRPAFPAPPMLRSSWDRIVRAVEQRKVIVPPGSLTAQVAGGLLTTSLWLVHRLDSMDI